MLKPTVAAEVSPVSGGRVIAHNGFAIAHWHRVESKILLLTLMLPHHTEKNKKGGQTWALEEPVKPDKDSHPVPESMWIYLLFYSSSSAIQFYELSKSVNRGIRISEVCTILDR